MPANCRLLLELPIQRDRSSAQWPANTARLLVYAPGVLSAVERRSAFRKMLGVLGDPPEQLYAYPLGLLVQDPRIRTTVESRELTNAALHVREFTWLFDCGDQKVVDYLLGERSFESVAFFWMQSPEGARTLVLTAGQARPPESHRYETALLRHSAPGAGFIFYSLGHDNLEILGSPQFVCDRCFSRLSALAREDEDPSAGPLLE